MVVHTISKSIRFVALLVSIVGIFPLELARFLLLLPTRYGLPHSKWSQLDHFRVRIIRHSLTLAVKFKTWNTFDWHLAGLLHKSSDRVKINRWSGFDNKGLLDGAKNVSDDIPPKDRTGKIDALWFRPNTVTAHKHKDEVVLYLHGGGYILQFYDDPMYYRLTNRLAKSLNRNVLSVNYRNGEFAPFPYGLQDAISAYHYLVNTLGYSPSNITIAGDSAGANLTCSSLLYLQNRGSQAGLSVPRRVLLLSPWVDLRVIEAYNPEVLQRALSDYIPATMGLDGASQYTRTARKDFTDRSHAYISPLFGDYKGLPKSTVFHITYGSVELLGDEIKSFIAKLRQDFKERDPEGEERVDVYVADGGVHDHQLVFHDWPTAEDAFQAQRKWMDSTA